MKTEEILANQKYMTNGFENPEIAEALAKASGKTPQAITEAINEANKMLKEPPTEAQVVEWFKTDLHAAAYSLQAIITMPDVMEEIGKRFYRETQKLQEMKVQETENKLKNGVAK